MSTVVDKKPKKDIKGGIYIIKKKKVNKKFSLCSISTVVDKSTIAILTICVIISSLLIGNILGSKSSRIQTDNILSSGKITARIVNVLSDGSDMPELIAGIKANTSVDNIVYAKNTCLYPEYIRIKVTPVVNSDSYSDLTTTPISFSFNEEYWTYKDGYYYYNNILLPGENTANLYDSIIFGEEIDYRYSNATFQVNLELDAVQSSNNSESALTATGWNDDKT